MSWRFITANGEIKQSTSEQAANAVKVYRTTNYNSPSGSWQVVTFDAEDYDYGGMHDTATNSQRLFAQTDGIYEIVGGAEWTANSTGDRGLRISLDNTTILSETLRPTVTNSGENATATVSATVYMTTNQFVELRVYQGSGAALDVLGGSSESTWFSATLISPAISVSGGTGTGDATTDETERFTYFHKG